MVTRAERLQDFITDAEPPFGSVVEAFCEEHVGTYRLPWLCRSTGKPPVPVMRKCEWPITRCSTLPTVRS